MRDYQISQRRACVLIGVDPKTVRRERPPDHRAEMREIAAQRRRWPEARGHIVLNQKEYPRRMTRRAVSTLQSIRLPKRRKRPGDSSEIQFLW
jgi:hypothetical protein